jgi:hypothetical protein
MGCSLRSSLRRYRIRPATVNLAEVVHAIATGDGWGLSRVPFLTFGFDPAFFERGILGRCRYLGAAVTVIADARSWAPDPGLSVWQAGVPPRSRCRQRPRAFHPKLMLLQGPEGALAAIGSGKTMLLAYVATVAIGFTVLRACPLEAESELAFAGLSELLRPILHLLDRIPGPQQAALSGALALSPPAPADRFAVAAATLSLLAAAAEESPLLAVVDDAQWLDAPSREALLFAGRRLGSEGVLLVLGMRDREWVSSAGLDTLELHGLSSRDAAALVENTGAPVDAAVSNRLVTETRGNPLAILEAVATLTHSELLGKTPIGHRWRSVPSWSGRSRGSLTGFPSTREPRC